MTENYANAAIYIIDVDRLKIYTYVYVCRSKMESN